MAIGFLFHSANSFAFFGSVSSAMVIHYLVSKRDFPGLKNILIYMLPVISIALFSYLKIKGMFVSISPISFDSFYQFTIQNEPDDVSTLYHFYQRNYTVPFLYMMLVLPAFIIIRSIREFGSFSFSSIIHFIKGNFVVFIIIAPWLLTFMGGLWEMNYLLFPDFLNDAVFSLGFRRYSSISNYFCIMLTPVILYDFFKLFLFPRFNQYYRSLYESYIVRKGVFVSVFLVMLLFICILLVPTNQIKFATFFKSFNIPGTSFHHFEKVSAIHTDHIYLYDGNAFRARKRFAHAPSYRESLSRELFADICLFIKRNTPKEAMFITPSYIRQFRAYSERQGFITEKFEGNMAFYNRRYATLYLKQFKLLHNGLTYDYLFNLYQNPTFGDGPNYEYMRKRYLSLIKKDIQNIIDHYPNYSYFLTESSHYLPYQVAYQNDDFILYEL